MPAFPPITDPPCVRVEFRQQAAASIEVGSRFFLSYTGSAPSEADLNTLATAVETTWVTNMAPMVREGEYLVNVEVTDLSSDTGAVGSWTGSEEGSRSGSALITSACAVVNHQVSRRYRGGRPRTYFRAGVLEDLQGTNEWGTDFVTDMLEAWEAWIAALKAVTGIGISIQNIMNLSLYKGNTVFTTPTGRARNIPVARVGGPVEDVIILSSIALKVGSQRRRLDI